MMSLKESLRLLKKNYLRVLKLISILLFPFFIVIIWQVFTIKNVVCINRNEECDEQILLVLDKLKSTSIFSFQHRKIVSEINKIQPIKNLETHFSFFNTLKISIETEENYYLVNLGLVSEYPSLSVNNIAISSDSSVFFVKPSQEIQGFIPKVNMISYRLWSNGSLSPTASQSANLFFLTKQKPEGQSLVNIFKLLNLIEKYQKIDDVYILGSTIFLSREGQPDIITSDSFNEALITESLQSLGFLTTMKKDPKIIDLRYKNPIIR